MARRRSTPILVGILVISGVGSLPACTSSSETAEAGSAASAALLRQNLALVPGQVDTMVSRLEELGATTPPATSAALKRYSAALDALRATAARIDSQAVRAESQPREFFREWIAGMSDLDEATRTDIDARIAGGQINVGEAMTCLQTARSRLDALLDQLGEIERIAAKDPHGGQAVRPSVSPATHDATYVKATVQRLPDQLDEALSPRPR